MQTLNTFIMENRPDPGEIGVPLVEEHRGRFTDHSPPDRNLINIISDPEGIDTRQPGHTPRLNLLAAVAQTESENLKGL